MPRMIPIQANGAAQIGSASSLQQTGFPCARAALLLVLLALLTLVAGCAPRSSIALAQSATPAKAHPVLPPVSPLMRPTYPVGPSVLREASAQTDSPAQTVARPVAPQSAIYRVATVLPTYPRSPYLSAEVDAEYNWPYTAFDREQFLEDDPPPINQAYGLIALENDLLRLLILPELGGRVWQVIHKHTGHTMFYQNPVVKPTPWGPANQVGWLGLGGLEWSLPVDEHGYDWGTPWQVKTFLDEDGSAVATIATPDDGRFLSASVDVRLPPDAAYFEIEPHIRNTSESPLRFDYWHTAMLAPGPNNQPSSDLRFVVPVDAMRIHSTGDERLPGPDSVISWPRYGERDLSRLGDWDQYSGFFEYPAAHGPYIGVYDPATDAGAVRVYPADVAQGSKLFALGHDDALTSEYYTDDASSYVELHGGLAPTFSDQAYLDSGEAVQWRERWYPVHGIGEFVAAAEAGALSVGLSPSQVAIGFYPVQSFMGYVIVETSAGEEIVRSGLTATAGTPFKVILPIEGADSNELTVSIVASNGQNSSSVQMHDDDMRDAASLEETVLLSYVLENEVPEAADMP